MRTIGLFGGSFNPVHNGHIAMAEKAMAAFSLDEMLLLPTGNPPHKRIELADKLDRLEMVKLALAGHERMRASDVEITREGVIYTVDTLKILHQQMPGSRFLYLIGADTLLDLHSWRNVDEVMHLCGFIVCGRPGYAKKVVEECKESMRTKGTVIYSLDMEEVDISATMIRKKVAQRESLRGLIPSAVEQYILKRNLYTTSEGLE